MADEEMKEVSVICGPYAGKRLTMPAAEADAAIDCHWARDPHSGVPYGEGHEPLSEEDRTHALEEANAWANTTWAAANIPVPEAPPPEPPEGGTDTVAGRQGNRPEGAFVDPRAARRASAQQQAEQERARAGRPPGAPGEARTMRPEDAPGYKTR